MTSHEMRNPLSAVVQCADSATDALKQIQQLVSISSTKLNDDIRRKYQEESQTCIDSLQTIIACSMHQKRVVDNILTLSKLDSNLLTITPIMVRPGDIAVEAVRMFEVECAKEGIKLSFEEDPSHKSLDVEWIMLDLSRVLQVLINLLTNAIKFCRDRPNKRIVVQLGLSTTPLADQWHGITFAATRNIVESSHEQDDNINNDKAYMWITVEDTGCGISVQDQRNLFRSFGQATPRTHVKYGGSGLGLYISKSLTELQNGSIGLKSTTDVGSTFAFYIGVKIVSKTEQPSGEDQAKPVERHQDLTPDEQRDRFSSYTILIVEDNHVNQRVLSQQLRRIGCIVHVAGHGEEALEFLKSTQYWRRSSKDAIPLSVVLMDIEMPIMDGLTCARRIRELELSGDIIGHVPILAVSANARSGQIGSALDSGMDDAITKPFRIPDLIPKIERLIRAR